MQTAQGTRQTAQGKRQKAEGRRQRAYSAWQKPAGKVQMHKTMAKGTTDQVEAAGQVMFRLLHGASSVPEQ